MMIDAVHDIQQAYRSLVTAFSFPGTTCSLCNGSSKDYSHEFETGLSTTVILLAMILLDGETTAYFHNTDEIDKSLIQQLTYVRFSTYQAADFVFFPSVVTTCEKNGQQLTSILSDSYHGTHSDPHTGATIVLAVQELPLPFIPNEGQRVSGLCLSGPGIQTNRIIGYPAEQMDTQLWWVETRNQICREFPLGIELILFDSECNVMVLPRSTEVKRWHM